jgi:dTDP-4-amino-4,6-dideoxygalactose transaminase
MLALGHPIRAGLESKGFGWPIGFLHLGPKYRPHLYGILLAQSSLDRLSRLNELRHRNWSLLSEGIDGCDGIRPVETLPGAVRGGFLEYKFILADSLGSLREQFVSLAQAEGVPLSKDRYGELHEIPAFRLGGALRATMLDAPPDDLSAPAHLPNTAALRERVISLPALTDVPVDSVRQCATGLRKVADHLVAEQAKR